MTKRAPKKFTDASQSEITPEWREWFEEQKSSVSEEAKNYVAFLGEPPQNRWPEDYGKDVGEVGQWIIVVEEPFTELKARFTIPTPSMWWARPETSRPGSMAVGLGQKIVIPGSYRVVIETPGGSLWLFPHEYVVCKEPLALLTDPDVTIHPLGGKPSLDEEKAEQMFYLQSRGVAYADALLLVMDGVDMRDWGWVEFPEYARSAFEGVGALPRFERSRA